MEPNLGCLEATEPKQELENGQETMHDETSPHLKPGDSHQQQFEPKPQGKKQYLPIHSHFTKPHPLHYQGPQVEEVPGDPPE